MMLRPLIVLRVSLERERFTNLRLTFWKFHMSVPKKNSLLSYRKAKKSPTKNTLFSKRSKNLKTNRRLKFKIRCIKNPWKPKNWFNHCPTKIRKFNNCLPCTSKRKWVCIKTHFCSSKISVLTFRNFRTYSRLENHKFKMKTLLQ